MTKKTGTEFAHGRLSILELLLLSFIREGLDTPYDLISKAGLSVGVSSPAFKRLVKAGLLRATKGPRNRVNYALTDKGEKGFGESLRNGLADFWRMEGSATFDIFPRAFLLIWMNFGIEEAERCIRLAPSLLQAQAVVKAFEAERCLAGLLQEDLAVSEGASRAQNGDLMALALRYMKASADATLARCQAGAVEALGPEFRDLLYQFKHDTKKTMVTRNADGTIRAED